MSEKIGFGWACANAPIRFIRNEDLEAIEQKAESLGLSLAGLSRFSTLKFIREENKV